MINMTTSIKILLKWLKKRWWDKPMKLTKRLSKSLRKKANKAIVTIKKTRKLLKGKNKIKIMARKRKIMMVKVKILWMKKMKEKLMISLTKKMTTHPMVKHQFILISSQQRRKWVLI